LSRQLEGEATICEMCRSLSQFCTLLADYNERNAIIEKD
jgi:hypothetical protein